MTHMFTENITEASAFDQANGTLVWERKVSPGVIDGQLILGEGNELIVHSNDFKVYMLDKEKWCTNLESFSFR